MDIDLLKTFLEVERTRHFGRAAENLFITQSAVSVRIRLLEETLGVELFRRHRNNIQLTGSGERLVRHAHAILRAWGEARQEVGRPNDSQQVLGVGAAHSLWEWYLKDWLPALCRQYPQLVVQAEAESGETLLRHLSEGSLDLAILYEPVQPLELECLALGEFKLLMVSTREHPRVDDAIYGNYFLVDWDMDFAVTHAKLFPGLPTPARRVGLSGLALDLLLNCGGSAYLAEPVCAPLLREQRLFPVRDAPVFSRRIYAVYHPANARLETVRKALSQLPD